MTTPTLSTERLVLRPLVKATQRQLEWLRDPKVVAFSEQRHREHTLNSQLRFIETLPERSHIWAIRFIADEEHIGNICAVADAPNDICDLGVLIGESGCWGKGFATEAFKAAASWLLDPDGGNFRKVEAGCMAANHAMRRVLFHARFLPEGERLNHFLWNGQPTGCLMFGKFR